MKHKVIAGIIATMFLVTMVFVGVPVRAAVTTLKVGVVGPIGMIQWDSQIGGAQLAEAVIEADAGFNTKYTIDLVPIDSHAYPVINPDGGIAALMAEISTLDFIVGGFRTECVIPMIIAFMTYCNGVNDTAAKQPVWFVAGAATDMIMTPPYTNYMFRVTPMNTTWLVTTLIGFIAGWVLPTRLIPIYGGMYDGGAMVTYAPVKTYMVVESLTWCDPMPGLFQYNLGVRTGGLNMCDFVGTSRPAWDETDYSTVIQDIEDKDAHLVIHIYSALGGVPFIKQFGEKQTKAVAIGINVESQNAMFYDTIGGKCEFETFLASVGTKTHIWESLGWGDATQKFWNDFIALKGHPPIYTAYGCYDGLLSWGEFMRDYTTTWPMNYSDYIPILETTDRKGLLGTFKFTTDPNSPHDVFSRDTGMTWPSPNYVRAQLPQWQAGEQEIVWPRDQTYSRKYKIPPWMYDHADTDWWHSVASTNAPDGLVDFGDLIATGADWQAAPSYLALEADMDGNNFINILDVSTVAIANGYDASAPGEYGQWPLP